MAVAIDAASAGTGADNITSISWTHTPVGTPSAVGIGMCGYAGGTGVNSYSFQASYNSVDAPRIVRAFDNMITGQSSAILGLVSPGTGAQTVVVYIDGSGGGTFYGQPYAITVTGSDTSTVFSNTNTATNVGGAPDTTFSVTCTTASDEIVMDAGSGGGLVAATVGADQTQRANYLILGSLPAFGSTQLGSNGGVMSWTVSTATSYTMCAASFKVASASAAVIKTIDGLALASVKTVNGLAIGSVKTIDGAAAQ